MIEVPDDYIKRVNDLCEDVSNTIIKSQKMLKLVSTLRTERNELLERLQEKHKPFECEMHNCKYNHQPDNWCILDEWCASWYCEKRAKAEYESFLNSAGISAEELTKEIVNRIDPKEIFAERRYYERKDECKDNQSKG